MKRFLIHFKLVRTINRMGEKIVEEKAEVITLPNKTEIEQYNISDLKTENDLRVLELWLENRDFNLEHKKATVYSFSRFES